MAQGQGNGKLAEQTMIARMGLEGYKEFRKHIGRLGGKAGDPTNKGFASNRERARLAGSIGGRASRRAK